MQLRKKYGRLCVRIKQQGPALDERNSKGERLAMNKAELIHAVAEKAALSKKDSEAAVNAALEAIAAALTEGEKVQLVGFGSFEVKKREARLGRNP